MAHSTGHQHLPASYLDGISVKISERYKPPKRITLALSYSQILTLNKLIQDPTPSYDFSLEESIKNRVHEWRKARTTIAEERKQRLHNINQELNKNAWSKTESNEPTEVLSNQTNSDETNTSSLSNNNNNNHNDSGVATDTSHNASPYYSSESGVLIPITVGSMQPLPHAKYQIDKGFNFSEFESDTSSPFDNMELKTLNDLEQLAEVWKTDSSTSVHSQVRANDQLATRSVADSNYTNSIPGIDPTYSYALKHNVNAGKDNHINGYYYNHSLFASKLMYGPDATTTAVVSSSQQQQQQLPNLSTTIHGLETSSVRSVPEIMKSLEAQLAVNHISEPTLPPPLPSQTAGGGTPSTPKQEPSDGLENPYKSLTSDLQDMVIKISYMGFPLPRVARACQALDGNQKKIVEHLLAMTDLLDLGFPESQVVEALLKCDNDRDKALDLLIT